MVSNQAGTCKHLCDVHRFFWLRQAEPGLTTINGHVKAFGVKWLQHVQAQHAIRRLSRIVLWLLCTQARQHSTMKPCAGPEMRISQQSKSLT